MTAPLHCHSLVEAGRFGGWGAFLCSSPSSRSRVVGAAEEAAPGGRGFEGTQGNPGLLASNKTWWG